MRAMVFRGEGLALEDVARPVAGENEILVRVRTCAVCRTDLHLVDGELPNPKLPVIPGHEVVGVVEGEGRRVGVPWLGWSCGECEYCRSGRENLCPRARFTGYTKDGGYAEYIAVDRRYCFDIPEIYSDAEAAPLLCAGLIGYRALKKAGEGRRIGIYGFGAAAHIVAQVIRKQGREFYAFTRKGDKEAQEFALKLGASWAGGSDEAAELDAAIIFAPVGGLVPQALKQVKPGGRVVCGGIYMSQIPAFDYELLWEERSVLSVANLTREDGREFFELASKFKIETTVREVGLERANEALAELRGGKVTGAVVLRVSEGEAGD